MIATFDKHNESFMRYLPIIWQKIPKGLSIGWREFRIPFVIKEI